MTRVWRTAVCVLLTLSAQTALAQERYAIIVTGASGGAEYVQQYARWSETLSATLIERLKFEPGHVAVLSETADETKASTAANLRRTLAGLRPRMTADDLLLIVLIGHGTFDGVEAKFNLVGPDLASADWAGLLRGLPGRLVIVNSAAASFPFIERLSGPGRIVISATDSVVQKFDTVFPEHFVASFADEAADIDKNGRVSIWEAFASTADGVRRHYQQRGQLSTERALLDDNGDGRGREAAAQGEDGSFASRTYLDAPSAGAAPTDEVLVELLQRRASLNAEIEELLIKKAFMSADEYSREFERVMVALARINRDIRQRVKS